MMSTSVSGKVIAMWMPILVFFYMGFEHSIVNMYLFPSGLMLRQLHLYGLHDLERNPTVLGNLVGGLTFARRHTLAIPPTTKPRPSVK